MTTAGEVNYTCAHPGSRQETRILFEDGPSWSKDLPQGPISIRFPHLTAVPPLSLEGTLIQPEKPSSLKLYL